MRLLKGDIVAVHGVNLINVGIEVVTHSPISHVALVADPDKNLLIEANGGRTLGYINMNAYKGMCVILRDESLTDQQREGIVQFAKDKFNYEYDYIAIIREFERYVFGKKIQPEHGRFLICSTLVSEAYKSVGVTLSSETIPSPDDIWKSPLLTIVGRF